MATRYGAETFNWLIERGWKASTSKEEGFSCGDPLVFICGDQMVRHPETAASISVYEAIRLQKDKTGEWPDFLPEGYV